MNQENQKYYAVLDILDEVQALNKVIDAHKNSPSEHSKKQYIQLKNEYLSNLELILKEENIDLGKILDLGGKQSDSYYSPIYNNIGNVIQNLTKQLRALDEFRPIDRFASLQLQTPSKELNLLLLKMFG